MFRGSGVADDWSSGLLLRLPLVSGGLFHVNYDHDHVEPSGQTPKLECPHNRSVACSEHLAFQNLSRQPESKLKNRAGEPERARVDGPGGFAPREAAAGHRHRHLRHRQRGFLGLNCECLNPRSQRNKGS